MEISSEGGAKGELKWLDSPLGQFRGNPVGVDSVELLTSTPDVILPGVRTGPGSSCEDRTPQLCMELCR